MLVMMDSVFYKRLSEVIFQGKSKKPKKGKMYKVDNRILGFSVTAAPDRINVGDRDYGEGV